LARCADGALRRNGIFHPFDKALATHYNSKRGKYLQQEGVMSMEKIKDLVCGSEIDQEKSAGSFDYQGRTYHFCSEICRDNFSKNPGSYIK